MYFIEVLLLLLKNLLFLPYSSKNTVCMSVIEKILKIFWGKKSLKQEHALIDFKRQERGKKRKV